VDAGLQSDAAHLKSQIASLGLDSMRVRAILLTHAHGDHVGGAEHLRSATGAKVYAGRGDAGVLRAGGPREAFFSNFYMPNDDTHPTTIDVELAGGETIPFGDVRFRVLATPGHTPGSICYLMERGSLRVLFAGDVISMLAGDVNPRSPVRKRLGTYSAYLAPRYCGDATTYLSSLRELRALPVPDLILPGHPRADQTPQSPSITQASWEALLDEGIADMEALLARYERDGADFLDGVPKELLPELYYLGDFQGVAVYGFVAASRFFLVDAPGGSGLSEFVKVRLGTLGREPVAPTAVLLTTCGVSETAGLGDLVHRWPEVRVVADRNGRQRLAESLPAKVQVLPADELASQGWFEGQWIHLGWPDRASAGYELRWAGKSVVFSGRAPIKMTHEAWAWLKSELAKSPKARLEYISSVSELANLKPDLWLPAVPVDGQNANLYGSEWRDLIDDNYTLRGPP
jgi:glyoxylase-like metal-dependent hydrolase (beta-lactamase superfamily II)